MGWEIKFGAVSNYTIPILISSPLFNGFIMEDQWPGPQGEGKITRLYPMTRLGTHRNSLYFCTPWTPS
jgi:hypothetical protein